VLLLFIVYSFETIGVTRYIHLCGGEVSSDYFFVNQKSCCCNDVEETEDDCCEDIVKAVQFKEHALVNKSISANLIKCYPNASLFFYFKLFDFSGINNSLQFLSSNFIEIPPGKSPPLIKLNCTYLI
jgi:hypothetical protein